MDKKMAKNAKIWFSSFKITWKLVMLLDHLHKNFEINRTKIKGGCQLGSKVVTHNSKSDLPLVDYASPGLATLENRILVLFGTFWPFFCPFLSLDNLWSVLAVNFFDWSSGLGEDISSVHHSPQSRSQPLVKILVRYVDEFVENQTIEPDWPYCACSRCNMMVVPTNRDWLASVRHNCTLRLLLPRWHSWDRSAKVFMVQPSQPKIVTPVRQPSFS